MDKCIPGRGNPERVAGGSGRQLGEVWSQDLGGVWVADGKMAPGSEHRGLGVVPLSGQGVWVEGGGVCDVRWSDVEGTLGSVRPSLHVPRAPRRCLSQRSVFSCSCSSLVRWKLPSSFPSHQEVSQGTGSPGL